MTSSRLSEVVLHSGGAHITSHNKHHDGLRVVLHLLCIFFFFNVELSRPYRLTRPRAIVILYSMFDLSKIHTLRAFCRSLGQILK